MDPLKEKLNEYGLMAIYKYRMFEEVSDFREVIQEMKDEGWEEISLSEIFISTAEITTQNAELFKNKFDIPQEFREIPDGLFEMIKVRIWENFGIEFSLDADDTMVYDELVRDIENNTARYAKTYKRFALERVFQPERAIHQLVGQLSDKFYQMLRTGEIEKNLVDLNKELKVILCQMLKQEEITLK